MPLVLHCPYCLPNDQPRPATTAHHLQVTPSPSTRTSDTITTTSPLHNTHHKHLTLPITFHFAIYMIFNYFTLSLRLFRLLFLLFYFLTYFYLSYCFCFRCFSLPFVISFSSNFLFPFPCLLFLPLFLTLFMLPFFLSISLFLFSSFLASFSCYLLFPSFIPSCCLSLSLSVSLIPSFISQAFH